MKQDFSDSLGYNIHMVSHFMQNVYNEKLGEYDLTHSQARVIYFLATCGQQSQTALQKKLYIKASSMNGVIESLLKHGRIEKQTSPNDKRSNLITLTNQGRELHSTIQEIIRKIELQATEGLSEEEQTIMVTWLKKVQKNMKPSVGRSEQQ
ncbi:MarR family winged helix-turn-helix transcriptional regulator [Halobacillus halophilus]|uniref:MarR family winged helix-turn-helix transcriptional regulator n=1 Tax=Halobacillus halophilus TaxID=1570 RepID=UPI001CD5B90A|nr:MarR family transcriptional regulator [Halobacillus halophilus]MCA1012918.1 MarR family transcriptional regulator [Halobacillus halophilus]